MSGADVGTRRRISPRKAAGAALVGLYVFFASFWGLGSYPLIDPDEPRYAQSAREMIERGDYLVPYLGGKPRINKPPLFYWLVAAGYRVAGGPCETAARFPSAAAGVLTAVFVFLAARRFYGDEAGIVSVPILLSMPLFAAVTHLAITDALMTAFLVAALYFWWRLRDAPERRLWQVLSWGALGLSFLSKGPVALVLYVLVVAAFCVIGREWRALRRTFRPVGLVVFLVLALPWPLAVLFSVPGAVGLWWRETAERFATGVDHGGNPLFPFAVLAGGALPWWLVLGDGAGRLRKMWGRLKENAPARFLVVWVVMTLLFFAASRTQLPTYILPGVPPLAIAAGGVMGAYIEGRNRSTSALVRVLVGAGLLAAAAVVYGFAKGEVTVSETAVLLGSLVAMAVVFAALAVSKRFRVAGVVLVVVVAVGVGFGRQAIFEKVAAHRSFARLVDECRDEFNGADEVLVCGSMRYSLVFYMDSAQCRKAGIKEIAAALCGDRKVAAMVREKVASRLREEFRAPFIVAGHETMGRRKYAVLVNFDQRKP